MAEGCWSGTTRGTEIHPRGDLDAGQTDARVAFRQGAGSSGSARSRLAATRAGARTHRLPPVRWFGGGFPGPACPRRSPPQPLLAATVPRYRPGAILEDPGRGDRAREDEGHERWLQRRWSRTDPEENSTDENQLPCRRVTGGSVMMPEAAAGEGPAGPGSGDSGVVHSQNGYCLEFDLSIAIHPEPARPCGVPGIAFKLR